MARGGGRILLLMLLGALLSAAQVRGSVRPAGRGTSVCLGEPFAARERCHPLAASPYPHQYNEPSGQ